MNLKQIEKGITVKYDSREADFQIIPKQYFFCVCSTYNPSKLHIYKIDKSKWIEKGITVKYDSREADFQILPKQQNK